MRMGRPDGLAVPQHRHPDDAAPAAREHHLARVERILEHVLDLPGVLPPSLDDVWLDGILHDAPERSTLLVLDRLTQRLGDVTLEYTAARGETEEARNGFFDCSEI